MPKASPRGKDWSPRGNVVFEPVPFVLLPVNNWNHDEYVGPDCGDYSGAKFDPWHKGDLVALCVAHRSYALKGENTEYETWHVMRRATTPAQKRHCFANDQDDLSLGFIGDNPAMVDKYRIPYRYLSAAARLIGRDFESRSALESALQNPPRENAAAQSLETLTA